MLKESIYTHNRILTYRKRSSKLTLTVRFTGGSRSYGRTHRSV